MNRFCSAAMAILLFLGFVRALPGQSGSTSLRGTVTDPQHGVVPGATMELSNPSTGFTPFT